LGDLSSSSWIAISNIGKDKSIADDFDFETVEPDIGYRFKPVGGHIRRPCATNGVSTLRGDEESACAHKLDCQSYMLLLKIKAMQVSG
jgi:hypothetical protein